MSTLTIYTCSVCNDATVEEKRAREAGWVFFNVSGDKSYRRSAICATCWPGVRGNNALFKEAIKHPTTRISKTVCDGCGAQRKSDDSYTNISMFGTGGYVDIDLCPSCEKGKGPRDPLLRLWHREKERTQISTTACAEPVSEKPQRVIRCQGEEDGDI